MDFIHRPRTLIFYSSALFLTLPLVALNFWILFKGQINFTLSAQQQILVGILIATTSASFLLIRNAKKIGLIGTVFISILLVIMNIHYLTLTKNYALAFYALFIVINSIFFHLGVFQVLQAPFLNPRIRWYEGRPRYIPNLFGTWDVGHDSEVKVYFTGLTDQGCYLYFEHPDTISKLSLKDIGELTLRSQNKWVRVKAKPVSVVRRSAGVGLQFVGTNFENTKEVRDFIDSIRSSGYVQ